MTIEFAGNLNTIIQIAVLLYVIVQAAFIVKKGNSVLFSVFFLFAMVCFLSCDLYWVTHTLMMPNVRLPFTATEIGEDSMFVLLGATLGAVFQGRMNRVCKKSFFAVLFAAASTALWIGWSGEWLKDVLTGAAFGYYIVMTVIAIGTSGAFTKREWTGLGLVSLVLIAAQSLIFFVPDRIKAPFDIFCYILMFAVIIVFFIRNIAAVHSEKNADTLISLSFLLYAWVTTVMYMSADPMYIFADASATISVLFMLHSIRKKVDEL